jgi:preprotein translocase subunit SecF
MSALTRFAENTLVRAILSFVLFVPFMLMTISGRSSSHVLLTHVMGAKFGVPSSLYVPIIKTG